MKLTRTIHTDTQAIYGPMSELVPDISVPGGDAADARLLLFVDQAAGEAHGFIFTAEQIAALAAELGSPLAGEPARLEVVRTMPGSMLGPVA